jgi:hypothetical protein
MPAGNETFDVFVSYSRADSRHAADIDRLLRANGLNSFFDRRKLDPGLPWVRALEKAIGAAKAAIVLIGPHGFGNTQQYERELAIIRQTRDPAFRVIPVILPETVRELPFDFLQNLTRIDFSNVGKVSDAPDELERLLRAVHGGLAPGDEVRQAICPWRGLDAFREEDSAFFFGRGSRSEPASPIGELVRKVREHPFVIVVGRSGSGKSSLVFAGLVPALRREQDRFWNVLTLRPGAIPLRALASAFNPRADDEGAAEYETKISKEADQLRAGDLDLLAHMIRRQLDGAEGKPDRLLLYIDQWEELYAQGASGSDKERANQNARDVTRFIDLLLTAAQTAPVTVVGTVRADFYDPLIGHPEVRALLPTRQVLLARMSRSELESTIVGPASKVGLAFDPPTLVQRILDEAGEDEGILPLLQYALKESWKRRSGSTISADSYVGSGGVREAIRNTAEQTFEELSAEDQRATRRLFLRLVTPGEGREDTRARVAMPSEPSQRRIVEQFAGPKLRLLVTGSDGTAQPTVEVVHEALIRTWPRLREWIDANRQRLRARAALLQAKAEWEQNGRRQDLLLPAGFQLERARALMAEPGDLTIDDIQEFIALSSAREKGRIIKRKRLQTALVTFIVTLFVSGFVLSRPKSIVVWKVGSPYSKEVPDTKIPLDLQEQANKMGYQLSVVGLPARGFAEKLFKLMETSESPAQGFAEKVSKLIEMIFDELSRSLIAYHSTFESPDILVIDNLGIIDGVAGHFMGIASNEHVKKNLIKVVGALNSLEWGNGGWEFLIASSRRHQAAKALALRSPDCPREWANTQPVNRDLRAIGGRIAGAFLEGASAAVTPYDDDSRLQTPNPTPPDLRTGVVRDCGDWGNDRLAFLPFIASVESPCTDPHRDDVDPCMGVTEPSGRLPTIGTIRVMLVMRKIGQQWKLLIAAKDPISTKKFPLAAEKISFLFHAGLKETGSPMAAALLAPPDGQFPQPAGGQPFGSFQWQPSASPNVVAEVVEFAYDNDARLFGHFGKGPSFISAGDLWTTGGEWKWRVWSISDEGVVSFSAVHSFPN